MLEAFYVSVLYVQPYDAFSGSMLVRCSQLETFRVIGFTSRDIYDQDYI